MSARSSLARPFIAASADGTQIAYESLGDGPGLIVVGGAFRSGIDYLPLASLLAPRLTVHALDRRGRGRSGPQGPAYSIEREVEDLLAVQEHTGATAVFGHSYGGLVALEAARRSDAIAEVLAYEPGVSASCSISLGWLPAYQKRLERGDTRGAFAELARGAGHAPRAVQWMPRWCFKLVLRAVMRGEEWRRMEPLLAPAIAEHEVVGALDDGGVERFSAVRARVTLLSGSRSPQAARAVAEALAVAIPDATCEVLEGLDHIAPERKAPAVVAERILAHLGAAQWPGGVAGSSSSGHLPYSSK